MLTSGWLSPETGNTVFLLPYRELRFKEQETTKAGD